jgi:hypothetical protein
MALVAGRSFRYKQSAPTATLFRLSLQNFRNTVRGNVLGVRGVGFAGYCAVSGKVKIGHAFGVGMSLTRNLSTKRISCG